MNFFETSVDALLNYGWEKLSMGQTAFQVSQAILDLDRLTLKNGCVAESGTFHELMEKKGYFYSLYTVSQ